MKALTAPTHGLLDFRASEAMKMGVKEYLSYISSHVNNVNLIRGTLNYLVSSTRILPFSQSTIL